MPPSSISIQLSCQHVMTECSLNLKYFDVFFSFILIIYENLYNNIVKSELGFGLGVCRFTLLNAMNMQNVT